ncbi:outer dense fiber protein 3-like [Hylaeus anthracinus]|uniref:outer dense fiber protein 3-like n=1 Tax=Hylaeus anthracinus TaxID=313031 RepID=UPI0023B93F92|nr:outer dense fiber protein 3-like [Hylaeus anthracinus]
MEDKENKVPSCLVKGPGPVYKLRPLVGYEHHCPSRRRNPAYSIRHRTDIHIPSVGPGPRYNVSKLTNYGLDNPPAFTIASRKPFTVSDSGPGPGAHYPEMCPPMNHSIRAPAYSIKSRSKTKIVDDSPGPNSYYLPTCIGPKIPDKKALGAFTIGGYHELGQKHIGPGPAAYVNIRTDIVKRSSPAFSLKWRSSLAEIDFSPGPKYYPQYIGRDAPMYSFGIRHSVCVGLPITELDEE